MVTDCECTVHFCCEWFTKSPNCGYL